MQPTDSTSAGLPSADSPSAAPTAAPAQDGPPAPRLRLGPLGITVRVVVAVGILMLGNLAPAGLLALLGAIPALAAQLQGANAVSLTLIVVAQLVTLLVVLGAVWAWMRLIERRPLRDAGWYWNRRAAPWLLVGIVSTAGIVVGVTAVLPDLGPNTVGADLGSSAPVWMSIVVLISQSFLLQAIPEELLFRGWLIGVLSARPLTAVLVTTGSFTIIHLVSNGGQQNALEHVLYLALPLGFGLLAAALVLWSGSLWSAVGVHGGFHLGNAVAMAGLPPVDAPLSWLTIGGTLALIGVVLIVAWFRRTATFAWR